MQIDRVTSPNSESLTNLANALQSQADTLRHVDAWPSSQLAMCGEAGVFEWFLAREVGGQGWERAALMQGYVALSAACLTTSFVVTQRVGACERIANSTNDVVKERWLPGLLNGDVFGTVGISHLTTSRRHLSKPVLLATQVDDGFVLSGYSPWVTGAPFADVVVVGATMEDDRQVLVALPTKTTGVSTPEAAELIGLSASQTGPLQCDDVIVPDEFVLAGPVPEVMKQGVGGNTGGLQTSALAIGLAQAAIAFVEQEATNRNDLERPASTLRASWSELYDDLLHKARGTEVCSNEQLRTRANSIALRATQAALTAAKGAGYVVGHPAGRWCQEALFFLVWSCPAPVLNANLCELAGIATDDAF